MAHNLNIKNNQASMVYNLKNGRPWHGWGQPVNGNMTSEECLRLGHLDFDVESVPVYTLDPVEGSPEVVQEQRVPNTRVVRRSDTNVIFTKNGKLVTDQYTPYSNIEAFAFLDSFVKETKAIYETAGALGDGEVVFITAALDKFNIHKDEIAPYLFAALYHDGTGSVKVGVTDIRIVCNNTLNMALSKSTSISVMHRGDMNQKLKEAMNYFHIVQTNMMETRQIYNVFGDTRMSDLDFKKFDCKLNLDNAEYALFEKNNFVLSTIDEISTKKKNVIKKIHNYYHNGIGQKEVVGTKWGAYNAITGYISNVKDYSSDSMKFSALIEKNNMLDNAFKLLLV